MSSEGFPQPQTSPESLNPEKEFATLMDEQFWNTAEAKQSGFDVREGYDIERDLGREPWEKYSRVLEGTSHSVSRIDGILLESAREVGFNAAIRNVQVDREGNRSDVLFMRIDRDDYTRFEDFSERCDRKYEEWVEDTWLPPGWVSE